MSRKPPKLVPVQGKEISEASEGKSVQPSPTASKQNEFTARSSSLAGSLPKRSTLTRHFLNCNGSSVGKRRFPSNLPSSIASAPVPDVLDSNSTPGTESTTSNGNSDNKISNSTTLTSTQNAKVNGSIANGVTSSKPNEPPRLFKRSKSLGVTGDNHGGTSKETVTVNGKKRESAAPRADSNLNGSQNSSAVNVNKRTSRLSQSSTAVSRAVKAPQSVPLNAAADDKPMPALTVACEPPMISEENSLPSSIDLNESCSPNDDCIAEEPKIIRKGDTVIKSYVDEKTGRITVFEKGMKLEVCDFGSGKWYPAKVLLVNRTKQEVLVHYSNWSSRYDEWISMASSRIRAGQNTNVVSLQFEIGERVEAVWPKDNRKYSGKVTQKLQGKEDDYYEVTFDDGIKVKRSAQQLFKVSQDDESEELPPALVRNTPEQPPPVNASPTGVTTPRRKVERKSQPSSKVSVANKQLPEPALKPITPTDATSPQICPITGGRGHFSVFDPPSGELGKRKRTVHDYSALVKGRQRQRSSLGELGKKRPKSEESSAANSPTHSVIDEPITKPAESTPKSGSDAVHTTSEKKRQKSGTSTPVPVTHQLVAEKLKEVPVLEPEPIESTQPLGSPVPEAPPKKRKSVTNSATTTTDATTPAKPEAASLAVAIPNATTTPARRTKSSSAFQPVAVTPLPETATTKDTKVDSGFVDDTGMAIIIEQNAGDGFWTCPMDKCRKNFRKDNLLKMHFKHYHPELKVANARGITNVVQMAQARTAYDNEPIDYQAWPKQLTAELYAATTDAILSNTSTTVADSRTNESEAYTPSVKKVKALHPRHSPEKSLAPVSHIGDDATQQSSSSILRESIGHDSSTPLKSPGLRRKGRPSLTNYRSRNLVHPRARSEHSLDEYTTGAMVTGKKTKYSEFVPETTGSDVDDESTVVGSSNTSLLSISNTPSPSISDQLSIESGSASDPVFNIPEAEADQFSGKQRTLKGRWSKGNIRRGLMNSNIRRVGSSATTSSTQLFLKKRMQIRNKWIGKRGSRQKRASLLSRISSGRMRIILEAVKQRSLRRKRFKAIRKAPEFKVDVINCTCSSKVEFELMVQCELCLCWQHGPCVNLESISQLPPFYACQSCSEPKKVRLSRKYEWAESEYYKSGKLPSLPFAPKFSKDDARVMKLCTNLSANIVEVYNMVKSLTVKERICFGPVETPELYEWSCERPSPQDEVQKDRFNKNFKPVLRRLLLENKNDPTYPMKLRNLVETRLRLKKYTDAVENAKATLKKKLGCRAAAFIGYICDILLNDMRKSKRVAVNEDQPNSRKENSELRKRLQAEQAYLRLRKLQETSDKSRPAAHAMNGIASDKYSGMTEGSSSNGIRRDAILNVKDFCTLKRYLKEKRPVEVNINVTLTRMSKEFPHDWKNLTKASRTFIDDKKKDVIDEAKFKWIRSVVVTYNTLRILLRQIYSETNVQTQKAYCLDFERTTSKLFDLFGIGLAEEKVESSKKQQVGCKHRKQVRGLETLEHILSPPANLGEPKSRSRVINTQDDIGTARKEILQRLGSSSTPVSTQTVEELLSTASETRKAEEDLNNDANTLLRVNGSSDCKQPAEESSKANQFSVSSRPRNKDGSMNFNFNRNTSILEEVDIAGFTPLEECAEEGICLDIPDPDKDSCPSHIGIIPILASSRISPEVCKRNLVRDILLQQHQLDAYLDKIEAEIIKLSGQSRVDTNVTSMKPAELSAQKTRMIQSLDLVSRLTRTVIGENDDIERGQSEEKNGSESTVSDCSDMGVSSDSDGFDNTSNYTGTDTETADEGDNSGDDDLLDI